MFLGGILKQRYMHNYKIPDPLLKPDDPNNLPQLERHDLVKISGLDFQPEEQDWGTYKLFIKLWPKWLDPSKKRQWSVVRRVSDPMDTRDHDSRYFKELEIAMHEGHERILIEPQSLADFASNLIRVGEHFHYYAYNWGLISIWIAWRYPRAWCIYFSTTVVSLCNAYAYSRYWRTDRLHMYTVYEPEYEETDMEMLMSKWGQCPHKFWMLKRKGLVRSTLAYITNQTVACFAGIFTSVRMGHIEEWMVGPTYRDIDVGTAINTCDYFMPAFIDWEKAWPPLIPSDIPNWNLTESVGTTVDGWFFLCLFGFYLWDGYQSLGKKTHEPELVVDTVTIS